MALFPIQAIFDGDFVVLMVPIDDGDSMSTVAGKVAYHVVDRRVPAQERSMKVTYNGVTLADDATVATAGVDAMDVLHVGYV